MANPVTDFIKSLLKSAEQSVLGIDIGSSSIKVVQLKKKKGRAVLETYGEIALGTYGGVESGRSTNLGVDKVAQAIQDLLRESNTTTTACALSIPISSALISFIRMPRVEEKQLEEMVPIEARKYIPVPISEVSLDWRVIPKNDNIVSEFENSTATPTATDTEVLLVAIHNDALNKNRDITSLAAIKTAYSEIEIFSAMRAVLEQGTAPQMIIDMGAGSTKIFIIERGLLRASHIINRGSQDITLAISKSLSISVAEAEKMKRQYGLLGKVGETNLADITSLSLDYIFAEMGRVVLNYQKKSGKSLSRIYLTGGGVLLRGFKERAESSFQTPVVMSNPFAKVEYPAFLTQVLEEAGPTFTVAIGLALKRLQDVA